EALRCAPPRRPDLRFLALLALGRARLRLDAAAAREAFEEALRQGETRPGPVAAARLGVSLATGDGRAARVALDDLERWGDRRLLAFGLADAGEMMPEPTPTVAAPEAVPLSPPEAVLCDAASALATAAEALGVASRAEQVLGVARALQPILGWHRVAWVGPEAVEVRGEAAAATVLEANDLARALASRSPRPTLWDLTAPEVARHPTCVAHGLGGALLAPAGEDAWLYCDFRQIPEKPQQALGLVAAVARLLGQASVEAPGEASPSEPDATFRELVGGCEGMRQVRAAIMQVGRSAIAVHVFGETGTGKERVAQALHEVSGRRGQLVVVNAAQLEDGLFDAEMFGHARGAFTGAVGEREGFVAAAHGGTLFLDEVAELSPRGQAKLLRFLETGEYVRLGETRPRRADVRILSAANVALRERVREQRFRQDLMYRLVDYTIALPPLRERGEDVLALARHFLRAHAATEGRPCPRLGAATARAVLAHAWPGNVRELRKQMHRAVVLARDGVVHPEHLQLQPDAGHRDVVTLREARAAFERDLIERRLAQHGACRTRAAAALGITRQALALKMRQYGL
ncbi:MAG TPA: sigma-54 dependent transcriptional regulator, partial [Vicinamibacteria bacterium]|nr:sigma-54 dependent transcriptional regulator [Vicinamibacteria bacterium]